MNTTQKKKKRSKKRSKKQIKAGLLTRKSYAEGGTWMPNLKAMSPMEIVEILRLAHEGGELVCARFNEDGEIAFTITTDANQYEMYRELTAEVLSRSIHRLNTNVN